jgi:hypothetical protein
VGDQQITGFISFQEGSAGEHGLLSAYVVSNAVERFGQYLAGKMTLRSVRSINSDIVLAFLCQRSLTLIWAMRALESGITKVLLIA